MHSKTIYLHHIRLEFECDNYAVFRLIADQLEFPIFRRYKDYLKVKIKLNVKYDPPIDSRYDLFEKKDKSLSIASWEKNVSVKTDPDINTAWATLLYPCVLPEETILHLTILEPLRYILKHHNIFFVHSAVLARKGKGLMVCGAPDSGKSTLAALLNNNGYEFLSDEFALLYNQEILSLPLKIKLGRSFHRPNHIVERCKPNTTLIIGTGNKRLYSPKLIPQDNLKAFTALSLDKVNVIAYEKDKILRRRQIEALAMIATQTKCFLLDYRLKDLPKIPAIIKSLF